MTMKEIISKIAKLEGKRHNSPVGDVREIAGLLCEEMASNADSLLAMVKNGQARLKRKKKV